MRPLPALTILLAVAPLTAVAAQAHPPIEPGTRVRVTTAGPENRHVGVLRAVHGDTLVVDTLRLARAAVTRLELSPERRGHGLLGAAIGAVSLGVVGAVGGTALCDIQDYCSGDERREAAVIGGGAGVVVGGLIGLGIGALIKTDRWEEAPLDRLRVSFTRQPSGPLGLGLRLAVRF